MRKWSTCAGLLNKQHGKANGILKHAAGASEVQRREATVLVELSLLELCTSPPNFRSKAWSCRLARPGGACLPEVSPAWLSRIDCDSVRDAIHVIKEKSGPRSSLKTVCHQASGWYPDGLEVFESEAGPLGSRVQGPGEAVGPMGLHVLRCWGQA